MLFKYLLDFFSINNEIYRRDLYINKKKTAEKL